MSTPRPSMPMRCARPRVRPGCLPRWAARWRWPPSGSRCGGGMSRRHRRGPLRRRRGGPLRQGIRHGQWWLARQVGSVGRERKTSRRRRRSQGRRLWPGKQVRQFSQGRRLRWDKQVWPFSQGRPCRQRRRRRQASRRCHSRQRRQVPRQRLALLRPQPISAAPPWLSATVEPHRSRARFPSWPARPRQPLSSPNPRPSKAQRPWRRQASRPPRQPP